MTAPSGQLAEIYRLRFAQSAEFRNAVWRILCRDVFRAWIPPEARVLDIGSGWGEFINQVQAAERFAMDLNPDTGTRLADGIRFLNQDCSQAWPLAAETLDVVFTSNFLEHLPDKAGIERTIAEACRCLKPGGTMICLGPNIKYLPGAYWDFWDHAIPITEASLGEVLRLKGFTIENLVPRFLPYSMSQGGTPPPLFLVRWYLRLPVVWPWFGKQFLVVGRKPAVTENRQQTGVR